MPSAQNTAYPSVSPRSKESVEKSRAAQEAIVGQKEVPKDVSDAPAPQPPADPPKQQAPKPEAFVKPIPTEGWPARQYAFNKLKANMTGKDPEIPDLTPQERDKFNKKRLKTVRTKPGRIIAVLNSKSAGKTAYSVNLAAVVAQATTLPVLVIDTNDNNGTTAKALGVTDPKTLKLRKAIKNRYKYYDWTVLTSEAGLHDTLPVFVIGTEPDSSDLFLVEEYIEMVAITSPNAVLTVLDCGNSTTWPGITGAVGVADDLVFVARADEKFDPRAEIKSNNTFDTMVSTMKFLLKNNPDKVKRAYVEINAVRPGQDVAYCLASLKVSAEKIGTTLEALGICAERLHLVPFSEHVAADGVVNLDPRVLGLAAKNAYSESAYAILNGEPRPNTVKQAAAKTAAYKAAKIIVAENQPAQKPAPTALEGAKNE